MQLDFDLFYDVLQEVSYHVYQHPKPLTKFLLSGNESLLAVKKLFDNMESIVSHYVDSYGSYDDEDEYYYDEDKCSHYIIGITSVG